MNTDFFLAVLFGAITGSALGIIIPNLVYHFKRKKLYAEIEAELDELDRELERFKPHFQNIPDADPDADIPEWMRD